MSIGQDPETVGPDQGQDAVDAYADKIFTSILGAMETLSLYLGDRLGWFQALVGQSLTASELAAATSTQPRYALEWLEMQAVYGNLTCSDAPTAAERRFQLPPGAAEVLTDTSSLAYLGALPRMVAAAGQHLDALLRAYRDGGGVSWGELGEDARASQAASNRPWFEQRLAPALASVPEVHAVLGAPGSRIADVGCGAGWSSLALARAYPDAYVVGLDVDAPSVEVARANAAEAGLSERVAFRLADGDQVEPAGFDAVFAFECLHDMPRPVEVLASIRSSLRADGVVVVMDEAVADTFSAPGDTVEQAMYGFSTLICLPDGLSSTPSAGTGTVMRRSTLTAYAEAAGFTSVEVLPIQGFGFFRFYRLRG
ncbi:MAG TPA: methyltransferase domain-containing protein [Propionibacteriaceae bacterium]